MRSSLETIASQRGMENIFLFNKVVNLLLFGGQKNFNAKRTFSVKFHAELLHFPIAIT